MAFFDSWVSSASNSNCEEQGRHASLLFFASSRAWCSHGVVLGLVAAAQGVDLRETAGNGLEYPLECSDFVLSRLLFEEGEGIEKLANFGFVAKGETLNKV